jgi:hypothetical protein
MAQVETQNLRCPRIQLFTLASQESNYFDLLKLPEENLWCSPQDFIEFKYRFVPTAESSETRYPVVNFLSHWVDTIMLMPPSLRTLERSQVTPEFVDEKFKATVAKWRAGEFELEWDIFFDLEHFDRFGLLFPYINGDETKALFFKLARDGAYLLRRSAVKSRVTSPDAQVFSLTYVIRGNVLSYRFLFLRGVGVYLLVGDGVAHVYPTPLAPEVEDQLTASNFLASVNYQPPPFRSIFHAIEIVAASIGLDRKAMVRVREPHLE